MTLSGESQIATHRPQARSKGEEKRKWNRGREHDWRSLRHKATLSFSVSSAPICWTLPGYQSWISKDRCLQLAEQEEPGREVDRQARDISALSRMCRPLRADIQELNRQPWGPRTEGTERVKGKE